MHYIGLDVHKQSVSYCSKTAAKAATRLETNNEVMRCTTFRRASAFGDSVTAAPEAARDGMCDCFEAGGIDCFDPN